VPTIPIPPPTAPGSSFAGLGVPSTLTAALAARGITTPRPIQARTLPDALAGRDILGRAETGSGKTLAFGLPLLVRTATASGRRQARQPRGLVVVPTRELADQVHDELVELAALLELRLLAVYGGVPLGRQVQQLRRGTDIIVATPGRLLDLLGQGACSLDAVAIAVLDEADHMADMGFLPAVTSLLDRVPPGGQRLLFSATLDGQVDTLVRRYLSNPVRHTVAPTAAAAARMDHQIRTVEATDKVAVAAELAGRPGRTLVFVRTKHRAARLARQLERAGRVRRRHGTGAGGHRHRRPRPPRGRDRPGGALRPTGRAQGVSAPVGTNRTGRSRRHRGHAGPARAGRRGRQAAPARPGDRLAPAHRPAAAAGHRPAAPWPPPSPPGGRGQLAQGPPAPTPRRDVPCQDPAS
jgi:superfamily II DNA/RNA helicase